MDSVLLLALVSGYGDAQDGYPNWAERSLHLWTNAARVDPMAWEDAYAQGGCSTDEFADFEKEPHAPLFFSLPLNEAGRFHSEDMRDSGNFSHDSSDGTPFDQRVTRWYTETSWVGENISYGYGTPWNSVMTGWMCSHDGHRANIMGDYAELGTGAAGDYYTQDFGGGERDSDGPIAMGVHEPESAFAGTTADFYADWTHGEAPERFEAIVSGQPFPLELMWGAPENGVYGASVEVPDSLACAEYYFLARDTTGADWTFPEEGSYTLGDCASEGIWVDHQLGVSGREDKGWRELHEDIYLIGSCSSAAGFPGLMLAGVAGLALRRRR